MNWRFERPWERKAATSAIWSSGKDSGTLFGAAATFAMIARIATWVPIRRAANVDPIEALRDE